MQNDIYNGDIYYKREHPTVRYALRGYNQNWHFPTTVNKKAGSSGYTPARDECPYTSSGFRYKGMGVVEGATLSGLFVFWFTESLSKPLAIGDCSASFEVTGNDAVQGTYVRQQGLFNDGIYYKRQEEPTLYAIRSQNGIGNRRNYNFSPELNRYAVRLLFIEL